MEVLARNVTLVDDRKRNPQGRALVGDVAKLEGGRVVARYPCTFADGTAAYACRDYSLDGDRPVLAGGATPKDWGEWMRVERERRQGYRVLGSRDFLPAAELEYADFREQFPHTAAFLRLPVPAPRSPLFDVGRVDYPSQFGAECRELLQMHDSGNFGAYGTYDGANLTDEELWTLVEQSVLTVNKASIASRVGPIRSRFHLPAGRVFALVTVLSPRGPRTLMVTDGGGADPNGLP